MRAKASRLLPAVLAATFFALALGACATRPTDPEALAEYRENNDPLEPTNRVLYAINHGLDRFILRPVALGYRNVVPGVVRDHVHNVLANLSAPVIFANDVLQTKPRRAGDTFMRFVINSTVGVGGLFDVASGWGWPEHDTDAGVTFALWGLPEGPFLFLPVLGPSNPRDAAGFGVDTVMDPFFFPPNGGGMNAFRLSRTGVSAVDARERVLDATDNIEKTALDPYATYRSLYRQNRASVIRQTREDDRRTVPVWFRQP